MPYLNPHAKVTKICPGCGKEFQTVAYYNQVYDTAQCYRRAKNQRRMDRSKPTIPTKLEEKRNQILESEFYFTSRHNPTTTELDNFAKLIQLNMNENKPIKLTGTIPAWTSPQGIAIVEQQGANERIWLLITRETSPFDDLLK